VNKGEQEWMRMVKGRDGVISFDHLRDRINDRFDSLSPHLQRIARYARQNANEFALGTVVEIAERNEVQPSSVVRFAQTFGFRGFSDLQKIFRHRLIEGTPELRSKIYAEQESLEQLAEDDPLHLFDDFTKASIDAVNGLRRSIENEELKQALGMLDRAETIYILGQRRAFPVAAYIAYGLARLELKSMLVDFVGGMAAQQMAAMSERDLLVAVSFAPYAPEVAKLVKLTHNRGIPVLAITDSGRSPLATHSAHAFKVRDDTVRRFRPLSPSIVLAQCLILSLSYLKDRESAKPIRSQDR